MYWRIEPYNAHDADYCVMPAATEADHHAALDWEDAADWINMQSSDEWRMKLMQRFGMSGAGITAER